MLSHLLIRNLAVVDAVEVDFAAGFTVLTGETGAGKSILIDALALALGARADSKAVRAGAERCEVAARFSAGPRLRAWLAERDLDSEDDDCLARRIVTADGRSRGYLNGQPVTMQLLQECGELLLDICGQQAHQSLRHRAVQRAVLDQFGGHAALADEMADLWQQWQATEAALADLAGARADRDARRELLSFQVQELGALDLAAGEFAALEQELGLMQHGARLEAGLREGLAALYEADEANAHDLVSRQRRLLEDLAEIAPDLAGPTGLLAEAEVLLAEAADGLRTQLDRLNHDPAREAEVGERLATARQLARKHRVPPTELHQVAATLAAELDSLEHRQEHLAAARGRRDAAEAAARECADRLSAARRQAAARLAGAVTAHMHELGMAQGRFDVALHGLADGPAAHGAEQVEFMVAVNPGQPPGALARVASGGELSRISLALQVVALGGAGVPTLIFDEVDAGVGGGVAEMVGARLYELSAGHQVLCVTHLPQVASQADQHLRVVKISDGKATRTTVKPLNAEERVEEIARMLGGVRITRRTREHAREMLDATAGRRAG